MHETVCNNPKFIATISKAFFKPKTQALVEIKSVTKKQKNIGHQKILYED
jgi:hypothetical protein